MRMVPFEGALGNERLMECIRYAGERMEQLVDHVNERFTDNRARVSDAIADAAYEALTPLPHRYEWHRGGACYGPCGRLVDTGEPIPTNFSLIETFRHEFAGTCRPTVNRRGVVNMNWEMLGTGVLEGLVRRAIDKEANRTIRSFMMDGDASGAFATLNDEELWLFQDAFPDEAFCSMTPCKIRSWEGALIYARIAGHSVEEFVSWKEEERGLQGCRPNAHRACRL